jgi:serine/threonine-protein kinase
MAPEQNEGEMFFQTDVYSFGIILFELLAGTVPFPLHDKGETARNTVRLAHMETPPPDLLTLRRQKLPNSWSDNKKEHELHMPDWLVSMIYKCLEKKPENRFTNGVELSEYITLNSTLSAKKEEAGAEQSDKLQAETKKLLKEKDQLQQVILKYQHEVSAKDKELQELTRMVAQKDNEVQNLRQSVAGDGYTQPVQRGVSKTAFIALLFLTIGLGGFATYSFFKNRGPATDPLAGTQHAETNPTIITDTPKLFTKKPVTKKEEPVATDQVPVKNNPDSDNSSANGTNSQTQSADEQLDDNEKDRIKEEEKQREKAKDDNEQNREDQRESGSMSVGKYKARSVAYFHDEPDETTRRRAFINQWNKAFNAINEKDGFIYVIFTNDEGQVSKGWLRKKDLIPVND